MLRVWEPFEAMMRPSGTAWPSFNETEDEILFTVELPGFSPEEVEVTMKENVLEITGKHEEEGEEEGRKFRRVGTLERRLLVPTNVNAETIAAKMENGLLTIVLPKIETPPVEAKKVPIEA